MTTATSDRGGVSYPKFPLFILFLLYLTQGLPYGFQQMALPLLLRERGASLTVIGFLGFLALPWLIKFLWAPLLDRFYLPRLGRRKSWIIPMQCLQLAAVIVAGAYGTSNLTALMVAVFLMNLFAATQDIAVDGFAIDTLKPHALGLVNTTQVVGYKVGMVLAGGILLSLTQTLGWGFLFACMGVLTIIPILPLLFYKEQPVVPETVAPTDGATANRPSLRAIARDSLRRVLCPELRWAVLLILFCKVGEEMVLSMFNTFLKDGGITKQQIGIWVGTYGMAASVIGSLVGGLLIARFRVWSVFGLAIALRIVPIAMQWWLTQTGITPHAVISATVLEHLAGGMLTTALFTFMMMLVEKRAAATEYAFFACLQVLGKAPAAVGSGIIAQHFGYGPLFFTGLLFSILPLFFWWKCRTVVEG
jgi:MFS family permease